MKNILLVLFGTITLCTLALFVVNRQSDDKNNWQEEAVAVVLRPVSVIAVSPQPAQSALQLFGEVMPEYQITLRSQVNGTITAISPKLQAGIRVQQGEMLLSIEQSEYRAQVAEAKARLAAARLNFLKEEHEAEEARISWQRSGLEGAPDSSLVLRTPQLDSSKAELDAAASILERAEVQLAQTTIIAPYAGLVLSRNVDPGESLFTGDQVAVIQGIEKFEVPLHLDAKQWMQLPKQWQGLQVSLVDPQTGNHWQAKATRDGGALDRSSRLRTLYLEVEYPYDLSPPLLPGTFVQADISGRSIDGLLAIPESALTRKGTVWYVDGEKRLQFFHAMPVFYKDGKVFIRPAEETDSLSRICVSPDSGFLAGQKVDAISTPAKD